MDLIYNDPADVEIFNGIFGSSWLTAAGLDPNIGAFLLLDKEKRVVADKNAARCLSLKEDSSDHDEISELLTVARGFAPDFEARLVPCGEGMTAGFIYIRELPEFMELHCELSPVRSVTAAAVNDPFSALMMICVEGAEGTPEFIDSCCFTAADTIIKKLPEGALLTRISENEFRAFLPSSVEDPAAVAEMLCREVSAAEIVDRFGSAVSGENPLTLSIGVCAGNRPAASKIHGAAFALFQAVSDAENAVKVFRPESYEQGKGDYYSLIKLSQLINDNLFVYHFQPIVSAHTGEIVAYEALMRSDPAIGYGPLEILDLAEKRGRLYDIEIATLRNTLKILSENQSFFDERHMFINSIPSELLSEEDFGAIIADYGELLEKTVVEFTERAEITDSSLECVKERLKRGRMGLAIDDYGTGYSNTSNLMRYSPDFVKIDRSLIADIDKKPKMQVLVASIIEFVHSTGGMALAEGVETLEEIRTVIGMSVDLLQGYYVSRPKPVLINDISEKIKNEIIKINLELRSGIRKVYRAADGENLDLGRLAIERYTEILVEGGMVKLSGSPDTLVRIPIVVKQDADCIITLNNVNIETDTDVNVLTLSQGCYVQLVCQGENVFREGAVIVPESAYLRISGSGSLCVFADAHNCCAVGNVHDADFGEIEIDLDGRLAVSVNGVNGIGIGGGHGGSVSISAGTIEVAVSSSYGVGIGSSSGKTKLDLHDCALDITANSTQAVCIGSLEGSPEIAMHDVSFSCVCTGNELCAIGALGSEPAVIDMHDLQINTELRGRKIINIGTEGSAADCTIKKAMIALYSEGSAVAGIGDRKGGGSLFIEDTDLQLKFLTGSCHLLGSPNGSQEYTRVIKKISLNE
ncbi:MAG: GGDEF domain-containing phosphodiesterase [Ruminococcus sp.]|nr:GGDEF domain-containing phosphodiesterase [Ruminococcus sp.]